LPCVIYSQCIFSSCWTCGLLSDIFFLYLCCACIIVLKALLPAHYYVELNLFDLDWKFKSNTHCMELLITTLNWTFTGFSIYYNMYWAVCVTMCWSVLTKSFFWDVEFGDVTILRNVINLLQNSTRHYISEDGTTHGTFFIILYFWILR
jgi:hypothetical protein